MFDSKIFQKFLLTWESFYSKLNILELGVIEIDSLYCCIFFTIYFQYFLLNAVFTSLACVFFSPLICNLCHTFFASCVERFSCYVQSFCSGWAENHSNTKGEESCQSNENL